MDATCVYACTVQVTREASVGEDIAMSVQLDIRSYKSANNALSAFPYTYCIGVHTASFSVCTMCVV